jgi:hypothetical protein
MYHNFENESSSLSDFLIQRFFAISEYLKLSWIICSSVLVATSINHLSQSAMYHNFENESSSLLSTLTQDDFNFLTISDFFNKNSNVQTSVLTFVHSHN